MIGGRRIGVFAAMSLDGCLAAADDGLDFLASVQREDEDYGYMAFASRVKAYVVGRRTYEVVTALCDGAFPHVGKWPIFVVTSRADDMSPQDGITFGDLTAMTSWLESQTPATESEEVIWCDGGGQLIAALSAQIDEWTLSVVPTLLGDGIPLFPQGRPSVALEAVGAASYESGLIQLRYRLAASD
jgi:dihydrofolate reductase